MTNNPRWSKIINSLHEAAAIIEDGAIRYVNHWFTALFGIRNSDLPLKIEDLFKGDYEKVAGSLKGVLNGNLATDDIIIAADQIRVPPGIFFLKFSITRLDESRTTFLLTARDSNCDVLTRYLPIVIFTAVAHEHTPKITYISPLIKKWTGVPEGEFCQDFSILFQLIHPEDTDYTYPQLEGFLFRGRDMDVTFRLTNKGGNYIWTHWHGSLYQTREGEEFLFGAVEDVTSRKEAEMIIVDANVRYRTIFDHAPLGIGYCDRTGVILECNNYLANLFQIKREQLIGFNALSSKNPILRGMVKRTLRGEQPRYMGPYISEISGKRLFISATGVPIRDENGRTVAAIALIEDMAERRSLELSLKKERDFNQAILESAHILLAVTDSKGTIKKVNHVLAECMGIPEPELIKRPIWDVFIKQGDRAAMQKALSIAAAFDKAGPIEVECTTRQGETLNVSWTLRSLVDSDNAIDAIVFTGVDVTERKRLESQLRVAQKMEAIGRLAGGVAHEFNNLLMAIQGQCELLMMSMDKSDPLIKRVEAIQQSSIKAADITKKLLTFSKKAPVSLYALDLNHIVEESTPLLKEMIPQGIELKIKVHDEPLFVMGDKDLILQAIINIISNSLEALEGEGEIQVSTGIKCFSDSEAAKLQMLTGPYCYVRIEDNGRGMSKDVMERAFEPFFTTKAFGEGKGLGLSLVHGIALQLGGKVYMESSEGRGTTVYLLIPRQDKEYTLLPERATRRLTVNNETERFFDLTILLVEDEEMVRETLCGHLEAMGATVHCAVTAEEALLILKKGDVEPNLLITDLALPGLDGKSLLKDAMAMCPDLMGIIISGYPLKIVGDHQLDSSRISFLKKPFSMSDMVITIKELLRSRAYLQEPGDL